MGALAYFKSPKNALRKPFSGRYIGSLVADFLRNLLYGGIFMYPADLRDPKKPYGKLRLTCECNPMAFIAEQAGGMATDGLKRILDIEPDHLHQRAPFFCGSVNDVLVVQDIFEAEAR